MKDSNQIRQDFIKFFEDKGHTFVRSSSLVPQDDPTLLFTNAGMNQFKHIFLGKEKPKGSRAVNSQKCIRVSGKHNDLEEVGYDTFHHTFFEMLGNWSFGDYYKKEAITWAWELITEVWGLSKDRLWATVYEDDNEAEELWKNVTDISHDRVLKCGKKDNFWEMGNTGPCGPCSEIHYYIGDDLSKQSKDGVNVSDQYWELWNLVFIQNNRNVNGSLEELPSKHVDTGAGLERITAVLQNVKSNYDADLFLPIIEKLEAITNTKYSDNLVAYRAIADHVRMLSFSISDGILPSNEGRGYVARRILRRAARFGHELGLSEPFIFQLVESVSSKMGDIYPELKDRQTHVEKVIKAEEVSFNETLDRGLEQFNKIKKELSGIIIPGVAAFRLYDTYGFPVDLTEQIAKENNLTVDVDGFETEMNSQKQRAREGAKFKLDQDKAEWVEMTKGNDSEFLGYSELESESIIRKYQKTNGNILVILDKTPFYGEQGGQIGDSGIMIGEGFRLKITDTVKDGNTYIHIAEFNEGDSITAEKVKVKVDGDRRQNIRKNHTATHLLHKALKLVMGKHVQQAGSLVHPDYLRFDFTHYEKSTAKQLREIEQIVNREILINTPLVTHIKDFDEARKEGAEAIFEEKYGDTVRMVQIADYSKELCGGTHVNATGDIGFFKITEESSLASGVRRLFAVTGPGAVDYVMSGLDSLSEIQEILKCSKDDVAERVSALLDQKKKLEKDLKKRRSSGEGIELNKIISDAKTVGESKIVSALVEAGDMDHLKSIGDQILNLLKSGVGMIASGIDEKANVVCVATKDLIDKGMNAREIAGKFGEILGGGGGGKNHLATAGGKDPAQLLGALTEMESEVVEMVKNLNG